MREDLRSLAGTTKTTKSENKILRRLDGTPGRSREINLLKNIRYLIVRSARSSPRGQALAATCRTTPLCSYSRFQGASLIYWRAPGKDGPPEESVIYMFNRTKHLTQGPNFHVRDVLL